MIITMLQKIYQKTTFNYDIIGNMIFPLERILINEYQWKKSSQPEIIFFTKQIDIKLLNTSTIKIAILHGDLLSPVFLQKMDLVLATKTNQTKLDAGKIFHYLIPNLKDKELLNYAREIALILQNLFPCHFTIPQPSNKIVVKTCASKNKESTFLDFNMWGDYSFCLSLKKALEKNKIGVLIAPYPYWYDSYYSTFKNVLVLRGRYSHKNIETQNNLMWLIYNPYDVTISEINSYQHCFIASDFHYQILKRQGLMHISTLLQCTDLNLFYPIAMIVKNELLFVGHKRYEDRKCVEYGQKSKYPLNIYGKGWGNANLVPFDNLNQIYSQYKIVLNDHWQDMREMGYISNKCYDIIACGSILLVDDVKNISETFGKFANIYRENTDFQNTVNKLMDSQSIPIDECLNFVKNHTYENRVMDIIKFIK